MPARWTDDELKASVASYLAMLAKQKVGEKFDKSAARRSLIRGPLAGRSAQSIEWRMRNISSVLAGRGERYIVGYVPATNTGSNVSKLIEKMLDEHNDQAAGPLPPMVFFNVGWMDQYQGMNPDDPTLGRHGFLTDHDHGHESFNFLPEAGQVFGYQPRASRIDLSKLGGARTADLVRHVLVVWLATHPVSKKVLIVGWYQNATVYRQLQSRVPSKGAGAGRLRVSYSAQARAKDATLLPAANRIFRAGTHHSMKGGLGQSPVWYGANDEFRRRVCEYIAETNKNLEIPRAAKAGKGGAPRNQDSEKRREVEKRAIDHATAYFESKAGGSYSVKSVELEGRGWDLEATRGRDRQLVEVKGLSGNGGVFEFTPNEYAKSHHDDHRDCYVIYIVSECLSDAPVASIFRYTERGAWEAADGRQLSVVPVVGARLTIVDGIGS